MLKRRKKIPSGIREEVQIRCPGHLAWVRGHECACVLVDGCVGRIEAAHVRVGTDGGVGLKPGDNWAIPLCSQHHATQHKWGEKTFEGHYRINMKAIAQELWLKSPHGIRWRASHE